MIRDLPENSRWSLAGIGNHQTTMNNVAIAMGGGVRVGLEDNIYFDQKRTKLATNLELIERVHSLAGANERELMTATDFRAEMGLHAGNGHYGRKQG